MHYIGLFVSVAETGGQVIPVPNHQHQSESGTRLSKALAFAPLHKPWLWTLDGLAPNVRHGGAPLHQATKQAINANIVVTTHCYYLVNMTPATSKPHGLPRGPAATLSILTFAPSAPTHGADIWTGGTSVHPTSWRSQQSYEVKICCKNTFKEATSSCHLVSLLLLSILS